MGLNVSNAIEYKVYVALPTLVIIKPTPRKIMIVVIVEVG